MKTHTIPGFMGIGSAILTVLVSSATFAQTQAPQAVPATTPAAQRAATEPAPAKAQAEPVQPPAATTAAAPATTAPMIQLASQAPAPPPPVVRTDKTHDGFYTRLGLGFGSQSTTLDDGSASPNFSGSGATLAIDLLVGGAPSPGIIIGGALLFDSLPSKTFTVAPDSAKTGVNLLTIGPFIDGYPNPRGGFHLGGTMGFSAARLTNSNSQYFSTDKANGFGLAAWLGYDWWVADQWSVGGLLRFSGAHTTDRKNNTDFGVNTRAITLMLTTVYQ